MQVQGLIFVFRQSTDEAYRKRTRAQEGCRKKPTVSVSLRENRARARKSTNIAQTVRADLPFGTGLKGCIFSKQILCATQW